MSGWKPRTYVATFADGGIITRQSAIPLLWAWRVSGVGNFGKPATHSGWSRTQEAADGARLAREKTWRIVTAEVVPAVPVLEGAPDSEFFAIGLHQFNAMLADYPTYGIRLAGRLILIMKDPNLSRLPWNAWIEYPGDLKRDGVFLASLNGRRTSFRSKEAAALAALRKWSGKENPK